MGMTVGPGRWPWILVALLFLAVVVVAWLKVGHLFDSGPLRVAPLDQGCDLRAGSCEVTFADGARVRFGISPKDIPLVERLLLRVHLDGVRARQVEVDFAGVDMNMGFNRVALRPVEPGEFEGTGMLPVCVRASMTWEARVLLHTDGGLLAAPFRFDTYLPGTGPSAVTTETNLE
jgi:hypothetical protein